MAASALTRFGVFYAGRAAVCDLRLTVHPQREGSTAASGGPDPGPVARAARGPTWAART